MKPLTLARTAAVFAMLCGPSYATAVLVTDPTGFTNEVQLFPNSSPFTDSAGNTAVSSNGFFSGDTTLTITFAHPVSAAGIDVADGVGFTLGPFTLSNGDSTGPSSCPAAPPFSCFFGVMDTTSFDSLSVTVTGNSNPLGSTDFINDFRYTPASLPTPEPAGLSLSIPLAIIGLAAWRLRKQARG